MSTGRAAAKVKAYCELLRVHNLLGTALGVLAGAVLIKNVSVVPLVLAIAAAVAVAAGGYAINDYFDIEIDRINKPERPIPSGRIGAGEAYAVAMVLLVLGPLLVLPVGPLTFAYALLNSVLMYYYSKTLKRSGLIGNLVVAFSTASTLVFGTLAQAEWLHRLNYVLLSIPIFVMVFLMTLSREIVKGVEDYVGDKVAGVKTLAVTKGPRTALKVALVLLIIAWLSAILAVETLGMGPIFIAFVSVGAAMGVLSIVECLRSEDVVRCAASPRRKMKISMFLGLLGILLDRALC